MKAGKAGTVPEQKKGYNLKFVIGAVLILFNVLRYNFGFRTFNNNGNSFDYNLLLNIHNNYLGVKT